jgi:hypothetical protein
MNGPIYTEDGLKVCGRCKVPQTLFSFRKNKYSPDGIKSICKSCDRARIKLTDPLIRQQNRRAIYLKHIEKERSDSVIYHRNRMKTDPTFKLIKTIRKRHSGAVKAAGACKNFRTTDVLGCTASELKEYIEKQFTRDMCWDNHGSVWHVDHIFPLSLVDWNDPNDVARVCHYSNLQPMLAADNIRKGNKILN